MNHVCLLGRIGQELELKTTPNGKEVVSFSLAVPRNYNKEITDWISVVAWKGTATLIANNFGKGDLICIEGNIQTRNYDGKDGKKIYITEVVAEKIHFVTGKREANANNDSLAKENNNENNTSFDDDGFMPMPKDDELPFF